MNYKLENKLIINGLKNEMFKFPFPDIVSEKNIGKIIVDIRKAKISEECLYAFLSCYCLGIPLNECEGVSEDARKEALKLGNRLVDLRYGTSTNVAVGKNSKEINSFECRYTGSSLESSCGGIDSDSDNN